MTRVLIVEDSPTQAQALRIILESEGFDVEHAGDGHVALERLGHAPAFDLVVSDIVMPRMSGYELCRTIKDRPALQSLPVVLVTTLADPMDIIKGLECGADNFVPKPYQPEYLVNRIRALLANRANRRFDGASVAAEIFFLGRRFTISSVKEQILGLLLTTFEDVVRTNQALQASQAELASAKLQLEEYSRRLEVRAQESEERYRALFQHAADAILVIDDRATILEANESAGALFGRPVADIVGLEHTELIRTERPLEELRATLAHEHRVVVSEAEVVRPDGSVRHVDATATLIDVGGHPLRLAILRDVTEHREMRAHLAIADRMVSMGTLAAGIAHEINNPLAAIVSNVELALAAFERREDRGDPETKEMRESLTDARDASERIREIVRDVKLFSRSEDDNTEPVDVQSALDSSLRMARNEVRHRACVVKRYGGVPRVLANESRLSQVFLNLIVNAAQAIPEGDHSNNEIRVSTDVDEAGNVVAEIGDTGSGMSEEVRRRLFTPFFTTKPKGAGTGLGLSICHRIITALGGSIAVESELGRGTTFRIVLPPASGAPHETARPSVPAPALRRGSVLVVDDEAMIGKIVRRILKGEHDVDSTTNPEEALDRVRNGSDYDVILCDLMMPQMTGMDFYREILQSTPAEAEKVIFLTGGAFTPSVRAFLDEVGNRRIEKPFDARNLRAAVNERIG